MDVEANKPLPDWRYTATSSTRIGKHRDAKHAGDCTIYASLCNSNPTDGICTCGLGLRMMRRCNYDYLYSQELNDELEAKAKEYWRTHKMPDLSEIFS